MEHYDVVVIGAGHAGIEAANISEKYGLKTALITKNYSDLGKLSCNPSIGGVGKTHIASEVDILGGVICKIGDKSAIHYRVLNLSKGPAVWGVRAQIDRDLYSQNMKKFITIIAFLLVSIPVSAQNYFSVTYINVSPENVSEVARLESTYWSKVAQANIDSGKLLAWGLFARAIPAGNDTWTHAYINVYDSLEKMLDFGQWNPQEILGINNQDIATGDLVNNYVVHLSLIHI